VDLVAALPASAERDGRELDLRTLLGTAWMALRGWPAQEVWDSLHPALGLANALCRNDALVPILWGLFRHVLTRGRAAESLRWVTALMNAAEAHDDPDLLILGHTAAASAHFWLGDLIKTRDHADRVLALYSEERHGHLVDILNGDPKTASSIVLALSTWMLGYPDQAVRISDAKDAEERRRGHPFALSWALTIGGQVFNQLREPDEWLKRIEEGDRVARDNSLPFVTESLVPLTSGMALIRKGQVAEGMASLERGLAVWEEGGGRTNSPYFKSGLAEGMAQLGDLAGALDLVDEAIAQVERPGWEERCCYAETLRVRGWLLALNGDTVGAERAYIASLEWARTQQAKSWGAAHGDELCAADARPGTGRGSVRPAGARLRLVHRGLRHPRPERGEGAARRARLTSALTPIASCPSPLFARQTSPVASQSAHSSPSSSRARRCKPGGRQPLADRASVRWFPCG
jgi:predicted ATPase